ncbi:MAG: carboxypeptidase regulatory-like domain-containing protein, partial [Gemmatimonadales bacterium]
MSHCVAGSRKPGSRVPTRLLALAILAMAAGPLSLAGQATASIAGMVTAENGIALVGADVGVSGTQLRVITDDRGEFLLPGVPSGRIELTARRLGFRPASIRVNVVPAETQTVTLSLEISVTDLVPVLVRGQQVKYTGRLAGYYQRLERGTAGVFVTRDQIDRENPRNLTQLLQRVPGVRLQRRAGATGVRMRDRTCWPLVWLDGNALSSGEADIDGILPSSLEGIELYMGSTTAPAQFSWTRNMSSCGTILLWSRASEDIPRKWANESAGLDSLVASLAVFTADAVDRTAVLDSGVPLVIP